MKAIVAKSKCPLCDTRGVWRSGQEFDHQMRCTKDGCSTVWTPDTIYLVVRRPDGDPKACHTNWLVQYMVENGASHAQIIDALDRENTRLREELERLTAIAPRRIRTPEGIVMTWQCPEELIPITDLPK